MYGKRASGPGGILHKRGCVGQGLYSGQGYMPLLAVLAVASGTIELIWYHPRIFVKWTCMAHFFEWTQQAHTRSMEGRTYSTNCRRHRAHEGARDSHFRRSRPTSAARQPQSPALTFTTLDPNEAIAHPAEPTLNPNEAFAWTAERATLTKAVGLPAWQITAHWNSPVVRRS